MPFNPRLWIRLEYENIPIYFRRDKPSWFVPNDIGDSILRDINKGASFDGNLETIRFLERIPDGLLYEYPGRSSFLSAKYLKELWLHITNRCNMTCTHCLFSSSPAEKAEIPTDRILAIADEAVNLGCRVFALTGGEPTIHGGFINIVNRLLSYEDTHVVILTNGLKIRQYIESNQWDFDRCHLQISIDGLRENHDRIRGAGIFDRLSLELEWLKSEKIPFTLSMCVNNKNLSDMADIVDLSADMGVKNIHFMWYSIRGRGDAKSFVSPDQIFPYLAKAAERAERVDVKIDNIESLKTQVFAPSGTIHDGTSCGWESAAVGPDGNLYPSPVLVGIKSLATDLQRGLDYAWHQSPILEEVRKSEIRDLSNPLRFITGGGDTDHSYMNDGSFTGSDPYMTLYERMILWLICKELLPGQINGRPCLRLKMGDILESCGAHGSIALTHTNCLLAVARNNSLSTIKDFYTDAVGDSKKDILNPVSYSDDLLEHIPEGFRFRGYGCGSPVIDANLKEGEFVTDLGCGAGVECFIASRLVGEYGRVIGMDMLDSMLKLAKKGSQAVVLNLGYNNLSFINGYLEKLPIGDEAVDVVMSNCVMNLSVHRRRSFAEIFRVLRKGGRLVISDVVCESEPDSAIRNDEILRGECIAGAMTQKDLRGLLEESGFESIEIIKRFLYRTVNEHPFFSLTYVARKPRLPGQVKAMYRGPFRSVVTYSGRILSPGEICHIPKDEAEVLGGQLFILDDQGAVTNMTLENTCDCFSSPESTNINMLPQQPKGKTDKKTIIKLRSGCMVCGAPISYLQKEKELQCIYCRRYLFAEAVCENGHFVCDTCHSDDALKVIKHILLQTQEKDIITLLGEIRKHPSIPIHGPEHHALVPGIILTTYKNIGGSITSKIIETGIQRGSQIAGRYCAFMGACGAALGVGIAFSLILQANPLTPRERKIVQTATQKALAEIGKLKAGRCCQRDSWIALKTAGEMSKTMLPLQLCAEGFFECQQQGKNTECIGRACPFLKEVRKRTL